MKYVESFLFGYLDAKRDLEILQQKKSIIENELLPRSPNMSGMPSGHAGSDRMAEYIIKLDEMQQKINEAIERACDRMKEIDEVISKVEDTTLKQVLFYRYIKGCKWDDIEETINYTERHLRRLKDRALEEVAKILNS